jgi:hypothetical protein
MIQEINTLELARIHERQGYFQEAFNMYQALAAESKKEGRKMDPEINAGLHRMEAAIQHQADPEENDSIASGKTLPEKKIERLLEQWLILLVLEKRLNLFKQVKSRF